MLLFQEAHKFHSTLPAPSLATRMNDAHPGTRTHAVVGLRGPLAAFHTPYLLPTGRLR